MSAGCAVWVGRYDKQDVSVRRQSTGRIAKELSHEY